MASYSYVCMPQRGRYWQLNVPGLAEGRPLYGGYVLVTLPGEPENLYQGYVHQVCCANTYTRRHVLTYTYAHCIHSYVGAQWWQRAFNAASRARASTPRLSYLCTHTCPRLCTPGISILHTHVDTCMHAHTHTRTHARN